MSEPQHYVYAYSEPGCDRPFYIGKGRGRRAWHHLRPSNRRRTHFYSKLWKMLSTGNEPEIEIIYWASTHEEACEAEKYFIAFFGRLDNGTGCLTNHTDGGEGVNGVRRSIESIQKSAAFHRGRKRTADVCQRISDGTRGVRRSPMACVNIRKAAEPRCREVKAVHIETGEILIFPSMREAERQGFNRGGIYNCRKGITKHYKGYRWSYANGRDRQQTSLARRDS